MKFGIRLPVPPYGPIENGPYIARYAKLVEELGFESIWAIDHALMRVEYDSKYPYKKVGRTPLPFLSTRARFVRDRRVAVSIAPPLISTSGNSPGRTS